jgi:hypothetical protein
MAKIDTQQENGILTANLSEYINISFFANYVF